MPQPTASDVHVNVPLTNISIAYIQDASKYVADSVFPNIPVQKQSDRYWTYNKADFFSTQMQKRAPGTESAGSGYTVDSTPSYFADVYAAHKDIDDQIVANTDVPLDPDRDATIFLTQQALLKKDQLWASQYFTTGVWTTEITGVTSSGSVDATHFLRWDVAGSDPISDITREVVAMEELTSFRPNVLVLTPHVVQVLSNHTLVLDRIKYTERGIVTTDLLAALFGVDKIVVPAATNNTAEEGAALSMSYVFGKNAALYYSNPNPSLLTPSAGYTFSWTGLFGAAGGLGTRMKRFPMLHLESTRIEIEMAFAMKLVAADLGVFFGQAVS